MPLSPAFRKDLADFRKTALQDLNYSTAATLIQNALTQQQQNQTYTNEEILLLRHALVHLQAIIEGGAADQQVQLGKVSRVLNEDTDRLG